MSWREFSYLVSGLDHRTPLGRIVGIRAETDPEEIKNFTAEQKRIHTEYKKKLAKTKDSKTVNKALDDLKNAFIRLAGGEYNEET